MVLNIQPIRIIIFCAGAGLLGFSCSTHKITGAAKYATPVPAQQVPLFEIKTGPGPKAWEENLPTKNAEELTAHCLRQEPGKLNSAPKHTFHAVIRPSIVTLKAEYGILLRYSGSIESDPPDERVTSSYAKWSFICSLALFLGILAGVLGIILGIQALDDIKRYPDEYKGKGWAIAGIVIGSLVILASFTIVALWTGLL